MRRQRSAQLRLLRPRARAGARDIARLFDVARLVGPARPCKGGCADRCGYRAGIFEDELIAAIARKPEPELKAALDRLIEAGLLFGRGVSPHRTYLFKHALVRDAAYSTLLRGRRQELHNQIVSALQLNFPELVVSQPEVLAHHSAEAGALVEAIEYYVLAAKRATAAMNNKEAKAHLKRGTTLVEQLPASDPRRSKLIARVAGAGWWLSS